MMMTLFDDDQIMKAYTKDIREKGIEKGREEGIEKGREEGIEKGREEGIKESQKNMIREMLLDHQDYALIKKYAGVSDDEIRAVEEELLVK